MYIIFCHIGREHLGIEYLSSILKKHGHKVDLAYDPGYFSIQDNTIQNRALEKLFSQESDIVNKIVNEKPDIVAFSVYTESFAVSIQVAEKIKKRISATMIFGGSHATLVPEIVIANNAVDIVVIGEGENIMPEVINAVERKTGLKDVKNIYFKENGRIMKNKFVPDLFNLDELPYPDKELFIPYLKYSDDYLALASRGCPYSCTYCSESHFNKMTHNKNFRQRSVASMIDELSYMKEKYGIKEVIFFDNIFHFNKDWLREFLKEYSHAIAVPFKCLGHVNTFDLESARLLKNNYCYNINFGIQSTDPLVRKNVLHRYTSNQRIEKALSYCEEVQLKFDIDIIFDLPTEKFDVLVNNAKNFKSYNHLNRIKCFNLAYYPKLEIVLTAEEKGILSKEDVKNIEHGIDRQPFYMSPSHGKMKERLGKGIITLYKILPILPTCWVRYITKKARYRRLSYLPGICIIFLQILIAVKNRDYRFYIYFKNYLYRLSTLFKKLAINIK